MLGETIVKLKQKKEMISSQKAFWVSLVNEAFFIGSKSMLKDFEWFSDNWHFREMIPAEEWRGNMSRWRSEEIGRERVGMELN